MTMSLADRSTKTQKVKVLPIAGKDPESQRTEMIKVQGYGRNVEFAVLMKIPSSYLLSI